MSAAPDEAERRIGVGRELLCGVFFLLLAALTLRPLLAHPASSTLVGPDPMIDLWTVNWLSAHLLDPKNLYGGNIFSPAPHAALYSDLSFGTAVLVAPLRLLLHDPVPLYNAALFLALSFGGWAFCLLIRRLTGSIPAGLLGGTLATFSSHQMSHIYHLNLLSIGWLGLFLLGLVRLPENPGIFSILLLSFSFTLNAQSSGYYAVIGTLLAVVFAFVEWRRLIHVRLGVTVFFASLLALLLMTPYMRGYAEIRASQHLRRPIGMSENMAFHPLRDLGSSSFMDGPLVGSSGERLFPGFLTLALAGTALVRRVRGSLFFWVAASILFLLSLGPSLAGIPLPYRWLFQIPPLNGMRHPYTFAAAGEFLLAVLAGQGLASLRIPSRLAFLAPALAVLETLSPAPRIRALPAGLPPVYDLAFALPPGDLLEVPPFEPDTLLWAARHGYPVANGAGAFVPTQTLLLERYIENHWVARIPLSVDDSPPIDLLKESFNVRYLIVPVGRRPSLLRLARAFEGSHTFSLVRTAPNGDRLYEFSADRRE